MDIKRTNGDVLSACIYQKCAYCYVSFVLAVYIAPHFYKIHIRILSIAL